MAAFRVIFLCLVLVAAAVADEEAAPEAEAPEAEAPEAEAPEAADPVEERIIKALKTTPFSLASARAEGIELSTVELLVDAYINLLDIMSKDDGSPDTYDEEDVLRQFYEYENPYVNDVIKAFEDSPPKEQGKQEVTRLAKIVEDHFTAQGFLPDEHRSLLDRHELFPKLSARLAPPQKRFHHQGQSAFGSDGHLEDEL